MLQFIVVGMLLCRPPDGPTVAELAEKLGSDDARVRAEARDELLARGESALPEIREVLGGKLDPIAKAFLSEIAETIEVRAKSRGLVESLSRTFREEAPELTERLLDAGAGDLEDALLWTRGNAGRLDMNTQADRIAVGRLSLSALNRHRGEPGWDGVIQEVLRGFHADPDRLYAELWPLVDHPDDGLRRWVLGEIRGVRRAERARDMLELLEGSPEARTAASRALGNMPAGGHSAAVAEALERADEKDRAGLLRALRRTGDARYAGAALACADTRHP